MKTKLRYTRFALLTIIVCLLASCQLDVSVKPPETTEPPYSVISNDSINNVEYSGWRYYIDDGKYLFSNTLGNGGTSKYNFETQTLSRLCDHTDCIPLECPFLWSNRVVFLHQYNGLVYFQYFYVYSIPDQPNTRKIYDRICAYNPLTDECTIVYEDVSKTATSHLGTYKFKDEYMYAVKWVAKVENPQGEEDYKRCFIKYNLVNQTETILFDCNDAIVGAIVSVDENYIYFGSNITGHIFKIDMNGKNREYLVHAKEDFPVLIDAFCMSRCGDWIYFARFAHDIDPEIAEARILALYRVNINDKTIERLGNVYSQWFFVTDNYVYFEYASVQPKGVETRAKNTIARMKHDGTEIEDFAHITGDADSFRITNVWFANDKFYFLANPQGGNYPVSEVTIEYDIATGECKWIRNPEKYSESDKE